MALAIRTAVRLVDQDDVNVTLGAGVDEYALTWDNDTTKFVLRAVVTGGPYLPLAGGVVAGGVTLEAPLTLYGYTTSEAEISSISFVNGTNTVGKIAILSTDATRDDGNLVVSLAFNNTLAEKFRIARDGKITFPAKVFFTDAHNWIWGSAVQFSVMQIGARVGVTFYTALSDRDYAGFMRGGPSYVSPYTSLTSTTQNAFDLKHNTSGVPAPGFGCNLTFLLQSSTTESQLAASISALWYEATHSTRKADLVLSAYDTSEREGLRIRGDGSTAALGFYGVAPIARAVLATGAGAVVDDVITALQNLGLVKQS